MPQYKYKKIVTGGPFGTSIGHKSDKDKEIVILGNIDEYTYIFTEESLDEQPMELVFEEITLTKEELEELKKQVYIPALEFSVDFKIKNLVADYPQFERDTFTAQENEALAYSKDTTVNTPFIDELCLNRGIDKDIVVAKILANAEQLKLAIAPIIGRYQKIVRTN